MGAGDLDGQSCFLHRFFYMGQDNTDLHENLTDIPAKKKPRRGDFANEVLNSFLKENNKESKTYGNFFANEVLNSFFERKQ